MRVVFFSIYFFIIPGRIPEAKVIELKPK